MVNLDHTAIERLVQVAFGEDATVQLELRQAPYGVRVNFGKYTRYPTSRYSLTAKVSPMPCNCGVAIVHDFYAMHENSDQITHEQWRCFTDILCLLGLELGRTHLLATMPIGYMWTTGSSLSRNDQRLLFLSEWSEIESFNNYNSDNVCGTFSLDIYQSEDRCIRLGYDPPSPHDDEDEDDADWYDDEEDWGRDDNEDR